MLFICHLLKEGMASMASNLASYLIIAAAIVLLWAVASWFICRKIRKVNQNDFEIAESQRNYVQDAFSPTTQRSALLQKRCHAKGILLGLLRFTTVVLLSLVLFWSAWESSGTCFYYYTIWNLTGQIVYFAMAARSSFCHLFNSSAVSISWQEGQNVLFDVLFPTSFLVVLVCWSILLPLAIQDSHEHTLLNFQSYVQHGINLCLLSVDFFLSDHLVTAWHAVFLTFWPTSYAMFTWCIHPSTKHWPYPFLDMQNTSAPLWYFGVMLIHYVMFSLILAMSSLKKCCLLKHAANMGVSQHKAARSSIQSDIDDIQVALHE